MRSACLSGFVLGLALTGCASPPGPRPAAIPALEARLARDTLDQKTTLSLAEAYRAAERLPDAAALLERTVRRDSSGSALAMLGLNYEEQERYGDARAAYQGYLARTRPSSLHEKIRGRLLLVERREAAAAARALLTGEPEAAASPPPDRVAVLPFLYAGTDPDLRPLGRAIAEMLMTDLSQTERLVLVERLRLQALLDEMKLGEQGLLDPSTAARTGRLLGAGRTVQGSLAGDAALLRLQATVSATREAPAGAGAPLTEQDALQRLFDAEKRLALGLYTSLGVELTSAERERVLERPTENLQALLAFGSGLEASDAGDFALAAREFARAAALDGRFEAARTRTADARAAAAAQAAGTATLSRQLSARAAGRGDLAELNDLLPSASGRDVAAEALGGESLGSRDAVLRIILPSRP